MPTIPTTVKSTKAKALFARKASRSMPVRKTMGQKVCKNQILQGCDT